jgi:hypothetical protein
VIALCVAAFCLAAPDVLPLDLHLVGVEWKIGVFCPVYSALCALPTEFWPAYRLPLKL